MKRQTALWVRKEEADQVGARCLASTKLPVYDLICFHCQQAAEKYLKALAQENGLVPPRIHDLKRLLAMLIPLDGTLRHLRRSLTSLNRYAVEFRYPGKTSRKSQAVAALRHAEQVRDAIRIRLRLCP